MKILVTGHQGYIGSVLIPMLLEKGYDVTGLDSGFFKTSLYYPCAGEVVRDINKDIRDIVPEDLEGFDAVLHLAGLSNDPLGDFNPDTTYSINYEATVQMAKYAKQAGVKRFIFSSSCSNYGASSDEYINETAAFNPVTPYGKSKAMAELDLMELADENFCPVYPRSATAYGMSPRIRFDLVLNNLVAWAVTTGKIYLKSDGQAWRPIAHVEDIARAFVALLEAPRDVVFNRAYNIGRTEENYKVRDLVSIISEVVPNCEISFADGAGADTRNYRVNCDRIKNEVPGFQPQWTARKGAEQIYQKLSEVGLKLNEFEGPRYMRLAHLKEKISNNLLNSELRWIPCLSQSTKSKQIAEPAETNP
jgi:nucleoside-diphosphate-sugar epimerase